MGYRFSIEFKEQAVVLEVIPWAASEGRHALGLDDWVKENKLKRLLEFKAKLRGLRRWSRRIGTAQRF